MKTINRSGLCFILLFILKLNLIGQVQFVGDFESELPGFSNGKCDRFNNYISFTNNGDYSPAVVCQECIVAELSNEPSLTITSSNKRAGQYSALISVRNKNVENMARMELFDNEEMNFDKLNNEFWYKVSIFLPPGYTGGGSAAGPNSIPYTFGDQYSDGDGWVIHAQLWALPDATEFAGKEPVFALITQAGDWKIWRRTSGKKIMTSGADGLVTENTDLLPYINDIGKWTDWVFHFKWGWNNDGTTEVWKNGEKVYTGLNISNCYNDDRFPLFKTGIYTYFKNLFPNVTAPFNYTITIGIDEYRRSKTLSGLNN